MGRRTPKLFLSSLLNRPQMIDPAAGAAVLAVLAPQARLEGYDGEARNDARAAREYQVIGGVAVIPVLGELTHRGAGLNPVSGLTSYHAIADAMASAITDPAVSALVLDIDSPGGVSDGCFELARQILSWRGIKPMTAQVTGSACSAAYAIACSCDRVVLTEGSRCGSIGVVTYRVDLSQAHSDAGIQVTYLYRGARKIDGAPAVPLSDDARAAIQSEIDGIYDRFCGHVAACRGMPVAAVQGTEAAIYTGSAAIAAGLADSLSTLEETLLMSATQTTTVAAPEGARLSPPSLPGGATPAPQQAAVASPLEIAQACQHAGYPTLTAALLAGGPLSLAAVQARIADAAAITLAAKAFGLGPMAAGLISSGVGREAALACLQQTKAAQEAATAVSAVVPTEAAKPQAAAVDYAAAYAQLNKSRGAS